MNYMFWFTALLLLIFPLLITVLLIGWTRMKIVGLILGSVITGSSKGSATIRNFKGAKVEDQKVRFTNEEVKIYKEAAGATKAGIPGTMPFSKSFWSVMGAITKVEPALPVMGAIHIQAGYEQLDKIEAEKDYQLLTSVKSIKDGEKGLEVYVSITLFTNNWEKVWEGITMTLFAKKSSNKLKKELPSWEDFSVEKFALESSSAATRIWASITTDYNPIHLHDILAKLFGQRGQIVHGMWSMARTLAILEDKLGCCLEQAKVEWKKPFPCGNVSEGEYHMAEDQKSGEVRLLVLNRKTKEYSMPHLVGTFTLKK